MCYRPPNAKADFWQQIQDSVDLAKQTGIKNILLTGDFNADPPTREGHNFKVFTDSNNLEHHIKSPTRVTPTTATLLDQFISNCSAMVSDARVLTPIANCDHCPIRLTLNFSHKFNKQKSYNRLIWQYEQADFNEFRNRLHLIDWETCFCSNDINIIAETWTSTFVNTAGEVIPNRIVVIRPGDKTFFTSEIRRLRQKKIRNHRKAKLLNSEEAWGQFKDIRNQYNNKLKEAKVKA